MITRLKLMKKRVLILIVVFVALLAAAAGSDRGQARLITFRQTS